MPEDTPANVHDQSLPFPPLHVHQATKTLADPMQLPTELVNKIFAFLTTKKLS